MASNSNNNHFFSNLPLELKFKIFSHLPCSSYESLSQTCKQLRQIFCDNKADICNTAIRTQFSYEAKLLQTELIQGFLTPSPALGNHIKKIYLDFRLGPRTSRPTQHKTAGQPVCFRATSNMKERYLYYLSFATSQIDSHLHKQGLTPTEQRLAALDTSYGEKLSFFYTFCYIYYLSVYSDNDLYMRAFKGLDINGEKAELSWVTRRFRDAGNGLWTPSPGTAHQRKRHLMKELMENLGIVECKAERATRK